MQDSHTLKGAFLVSYIFYLIKSHWQMFIQQFKIYIPLINGRARFIFSII